MKGLKSKVMDFQLKLPKEKGIRYVPYCDFKRHRGLILKEEICKERNCRHYYKLYVKK